jgi:hypothetical protein
VKPFSFHHVYRERNGDAYHLSKAGLELVEGVWHIQELVDRKSSEYFHAPCPMRTSDYVPSISFLSWFEAQYISFYVIYGAF